MDAAEPYIATATLVDVAENEAVMMKESVTKFSGTFVHSAPGGTEKNQCSKPLALYIFSHNRLKNRWITASNPAIITIMQKLQIGVVATILPSLECTVGRAQSRKHCLFSLRLRNLSFGLCLTAWRGSNRS